MYGSASVMEQTWGVSWPGWVRWTMHHVASEHRLLRVWSAHKRTNCHDSTKLKRVKPSERNQDLTFTGSPRTDETETWQPMVKHDLAGLPRWLSGKEFICQCGTHGFDPWVGKIPRRRKWQPTPLFLPGEFHGPEESRGYSPWGHKESDTTYWLNNKKWGY